MPVVRTPELIGLIPAAGRATRIAPLPCSKELLPVGFWSRAGEPARPKVACHHLLEKMAVAGVRRTFVVLREGKWDIPGYFGSRFEGMDMGYLLMRRPWGVPFTLADAYPFVRDAIVVFGFPDILFQPADVFTVLLRRREATDADLVLALFRSSRPENDDGVELDARGGIVRIEPKRGDTGCEHTWIVAVWGPAFTELLHAFTEVAAPDVAAHGGLWGGREMYVSDVVWAAVTAGLHVEAVRFDEGSYLDIGTPDDLLVALRGQAMVPAPSSASPVQRGSAA